MSDQALNRVIEELRTRGLRAGEADGAQLVQAAQAKADQVVADAKAEAEKIVSDAQAQAESLRRQLEAELKQASANGLLAFQSAVEKSFLVPAVADALRPVLQDQTILKRAIIESSRAFAGARGAQNDLELLLPAAQKQALDGAFVAELKARAGAGLTVRFDDGFSFGFKIAPSGSGYLYDFSDDGFKEIFLRFLAPRFRSAFFDQE